MLKEYTKLSARNDDRERIYTKLSAINDDLEIIYKTTSITMYITKKTEASGIV